MSFRFGQFKVSLFRREINVITVFWHCAGLICFSADRWALHFFVRPKYWVWGNASGECDRFIGFGPLFLYCED